MWHKLSLAKCEKCRQGGPAIVALLAPQLACEPLKVRGPVPLWGFKEREADTAGLLAHQLDTACRFDPGCNTVDERRQSILEGRSKVGLELVAEKYRYRAIVYENGHDENLFDLKLPHHRSIQLAFNPWRFHRVPREYDGKPTSPRNAFLDFSTQRVANFHFPLIPPHSYAERVKFTGKAGNKLAILARVANEQVL